MSSFFTIPGAQKKRKRPAASATEAPKKRVATAAKGRPSASTKGARPLATNGAPNSTGKGKPPATRRREERDSSISGSDDEDDHSDDNARQSSPEPGADSDGSDDDGSEHAGETAAERRLRLAERYLANVRDEVQEVEGFDAEQIDRDLIAERLQEDVAEAKGKIYRRLAGELAFADATHTLFRSNNDNVITAVATCAPYAYTTSKDMHLVKWRLQDLPQHQWPQTTKKKPKKSPAPPKRQPERVKYTKGDRRRDKDKGFRGHTGEILAVAASQDGKFVVTAGADRRLVVHDASSLKPIRAWTHHRDAITGLAFRRGTNQLFSCSKDRTVKVWSLDELAYVETLFGHQDDVVDVDALAQERCVSVGARDRTARLWKVVEETQLVFRGGGGGGSGDKKSAALARAAGAHPKSLAHEGSMDRVAMLDDELFVTGSDNGSIALWSTQKKKPLFVVPRAHGIESPLDPRQASGEEHPDPARVVPPPQPRWITALKAIPYSDVILSGSWDGYVRVWRLSEDKKRVEAVGVLGARPEAESSEASSGSGLAPVDGVVDGTHPDGEEEVEESAGKPKEDPGRGGWRIKGIVNDISAFERGDRGKDGLCVVIAVGKEHRLGRWKTVKGGRNGAMVFEVPRAPAPKVNGMHAAG